METQKVDKMKPANSLDYSINDVLPPKLLMENPSQNSVSCELPKLIDCFKRFSLSRFSSFNALQKEATCQ